jgi:hypothetical protein
VRFGAVSDPPVGFLLDVSLDDGEDDDGVLLVDVEGAVRAGAESDPPVGLPPVDFVGDVLFELVVAFCPPVPVDGAVRLGAESEPPPGPPPDGLFDVLFVLLVVFPVVTGMRASSD